MITLATMTGIAIGLATGSIAGNGMTVVRDNNGNKKIKEINWGKGYKDSIIAPAAMTAAAYLAILVLGESMIENVVEKQTEYEETKIQRRDEIIDLTDKVMDDLKETRFEAEKESFLRMAEIARSNKDNLKDITIGIKDKDTDEMILKLNKFEAYGLANLDDKQIEDIVYDSIKEEVDTEREILKESLSSKYLDLWHYDEIEELYEAMQEEAEEYKVMDKDLFVS